MAWTNPRTWASPEVVTDTELNEQIRDNLNTLSTHTHTGAAGEGGEIVPPPFSNDKRLGITFLLYAGSISDSQISSEQTNGTHTLLWDSTNKMIYLQLQVTNNSGYCRGKTYIGVTTQLLPTYNIGLAHESTVTSTIRIGLADDNLNADPANGLYFRCTNGGNWEAVARNASSETATSTGVAASTTPKEFKIKVTGTGTVEYYIDDVLKATITSGNIPATTTILNARYGYVASATATLNARIAQWMGLSYKVKSS